MRTRLFAASAIGVMVLVLALPSARPAQAVSSSIVISQVYAAGGNTGAIYANDYVELFNLGATPASLDGWSVQYSSATGTSWVNQWTLPNAVLQPGQYYLLQGASGGLGGAPLPTPDLTSTINIGSTGGKLALASTTTPLTGPCPLLDVVDFVGYGTADCSEISAAPAGDAMDAIFRAGLGCTDSDQNALDFGLAVPNPRNTATAASPCSAPPGPPATEGTVVGNVDVQSSALCLELSTTAIDFGQLPLGAEAAPATPDITVTNCSSDSESVMASGTDATGTGASWNLVDSADTCAGALGTDNYHLALQSSSATVTLGTTAKALGTYTGGASDAQTALIDTACPGSSGAGTSMTMQITFTATAP